MTDNDQPPSMKKIALVALGFLGIVGAVLIGVPSLVKVKQGDSSKGVALASDELTKKECGACHDAYSPMFLPGYSWEKIMNNLSDHFGEDASLSEETRQHILAYMIGERPTEVPIRITSTDIFNKIHDKKVKTQAKEISVKLFNCTECHK